MARAAAVVAAYDRLAGQIQVAQRVEDLVTHELVFVAQAVVIEDAVMTKHHGILQRPAASKAQRAQMLDLLHETEGAGAGDRSEEHTSELQSLMRISYAVFCLKKKKTYKETHTKDTN